MGKGASSASQSRSLAAEGTSTDPLTQHFGRAHFVSEQPGSPKHGLDELLAHYRHKGAPGEQKTPDRR